MRVVCLIALVLAGCAEGPLGTVDGTADMGPVCPVERDPPDPDCADRPFEGTLRLLDEGREVRRFEIEDGTFRLRLAPGTYTIEDASDGPLYCQEGPFAVRAGETTSVHVDCDTGIR